MGAKRVRALSNDLANSAFRPGYLRSVGPGWTNWALETFMDEAPATYFSHLLLNQKLGKNNALLKYPKCLSWLP